MAELIAQTVLLGLIASIRPVVIPALLAILAAKEHARARGLALLGGVAVGMVILCLLALAVADVIPTFEFGADRTKLLRISALCGALMAAAGVFLLVARPKFALPERFRQTTGSAGSGRHLGPIAAVGVLKTVFNSRMILIALAMAAVISAFPIFPNRKEFAIAVFFLLSLTLVGGIMIYFLLWPEHAATRLDLLSKWTLGHAATLLGVLSLVIGVFMMFASLSGLS